MRLKEIFLYYSKNHSSVGGKTLPFELIGKSLGSLTLAGLMKLFKDYDIYFNKVKLQFLFKRFGQDGTLVTYD
jgi:hypothetical protein